MDVKQRICMAIQDYRRKQGFSPKRITVSYDIARELDAAMAAAAESIAEPQNAPLITDGAQFTLMGIPVVADLPAEDVLDIRS